MPIYEYQCESCRRRVSLFFKSVKLEEAPRCPRCGGKRLTRLFSRFAVVWSEEDRLERLADPSRFGDLDENDPKSVARWMKRMAKETGLGEEMGEEDYEQMVEEAMEGGEKAETEGLDEGS